MNAFNLWMPVLTGVTILAIILGPILAPKRTDAEKSAIAQANG
jgi:hypothetical protein